MKTIFLIDFAESSKASFALNQAVIAAGWVMLCMSFTVTEAMAGSTDHQISISDPSYLPTTGINNMTSTRVNSESKTLQWQVINNNSIRCMADFAVGDIVSVQLNWPYK